MNRSHIVRMYRMAAERGFNGSPEGSGWKGRSSCRSREWLHHSSRPWADQPYRGVADGHDAHAAALRHVDHLLLRRPPQDCQPVVGGGETHEHVERLAVDIYLRREERE